MTAIKLWYLSGNKTTNGTPHFAKFSRNSSPLSPGVKLPLTTRWSTSSGGSNNSTMRDMVAARSMNSLSSTSSQAVASYSRSSPDSACDLLRMHTILVTIAFISLASRRCLSLCMSRPCCIISSNSKTLR